MKVFKTEMCACENGGATFSRKSKQKRLCDNCNAIKIKQYKHDLYMSKHPKAAFSKRVIDETGKRYGRLSVLEYVGNNKNGAALFKCKCDCGKEITVTGAKLRNGTTKSCGCYCKDKARERLLIFNKSDKYVQPTHFIHGGKRSRLYRTWCNMKSRCSNPHRDHYDCYGGRGITVCDEWINDFAAFRAWALDNGYSDDKTIDRIDVSKGYSPDNCRWSAQKEQCRNRRNTLFYKHNGVRKPFIEWCEQFGVNYKLAHARYKKGYAFEQIFS